MYLSFEPKNFWLLLSADSQFNKIERFRTYGLPCNSKRVKTEEKEPEISYKGKSLDEILNQALAGRERILGQSRPSSASRCFKCQKSNDLYKTAKCCSDKKDFFIVCRHCITDFCDNWKCTICDQGRKRQDFIKFHSVR